jgi:superfamily II DNA or RNA helicase
MTPLAPPLEKFFREYLPRDRGCSPHTCDAYARAFRLLVCFAAERHATTPSALALEQLDAATVLAFLADLEQGRGNSASTRNARLAAINHRCWPEGDPVASPGYTCRPPGRMVTLGPSGPHYLPPDPQDPMTFSLRPQFAPEDWQRSAVEAFFASKPKPCHGIFDVYTGAGKTVLALAVMARVVQDRGNTKFAIVVPTIALAQQWLQTIPKVTDIDPSRVAMVGGGRSGSFDTSDVLVYVIATARALKRGRSRLAQDTGRHPVMLVVDECHKAGARASSKIFDANTVARLGLSATPLRGGQDAVDEDGLPVPLEHQRHGRAIGPVCYALSLRDGVRRRMLPRFQIHHHGIDLSASEAQSYADHNRTVRDAAKDLERAGGQFSKYLVYIRYPKRYSDSVVRAAMALQVAMFVRKQFLYSASERLRVAQQLILNAWATSPPSGAILFNERINDASDDGVEDVVEDVEEDHQRFGATRLYKEIVALAETGRLSLKKEAVALEHSGLPAAARIAALDGLRSGRVQILCTVKALQEGIDVPDVGMGVSVASTSSARQRIQTMGRILRAKRDERGRRIDPDLAPIKMLHLLYVKNTVDEEIYRHTDWNLETGDDRNHWWHWQYQKELPHEDEPLVPKVVDEHTAWSRIATLPMPQKWDGPARGLALTYARGTVAPVSNKDLPVHNAAQLMPILDAGERVGRIKSARGPFTVTPLLNVVVKRGPSDEDPNEQVYWALGRVDELPMWEGRAHADDRAAEADAVKTQADGAAPVHLLRDAAAFEALVESTFDELKEEEESGQGPASADYWYVLLQYAFHGAAEGDLAMSVAASRMLQTRGFSARVQAAKRAAAYLSGLEEAPSVALPPPGTTLPEIVPYVARAVVHERMDCVRAALDAFRPTAGQNPRRIAFLRCLQMITGEKRSIYKPY